VELASLFDRDLEARGSDGQLCRLHAGDLGRCEVADEGAGAFGDVECGLVQTFELAVHQQVEHRRVGRVGDDLVPVEGAERRRELARARDELGHPRQDLVEASLRRDKEAPRSL
jgi:hypothetical protein